MTTSIHALLSELFHHGVRVGRSQPDPTTRDDYFALKTKLETHLALPYMQAHLTSFIDEIRADKVKRPVPTGPLPTGWTSHPLPQVLDAEPNFLKCPSKWEFEYRSLPNWEHSVFNTYARDSITARGSTYTWSGDDGAFARRAIKPVNWLWGEADGYRGLAESPIALTTPTGITTVTSLAPVWRCTGHSCPTRDPVMSTAAPTCYTCGKTMEPTGGRP